MNPKNALADAVELDYPREGATLSITNDSCSFAIGGCLHNTSSGQSKPSAFFSTKLFEAGLPLTESSWQFSQHLKVERLLAED